MKQGWRLNRRHVLAGGGAVAALGLSGCGSGPPVPPSDALAAGLATGPDTLHPYIDQTREGNFLKRNIFDALFHTDGDTLEPGPGLAESWNDADDRLLEITMRPDARFHDGSPVTNADAAWTLNHIVQRGAAEGFAGASRYNWIERAEPVGERGLRIISTRPTPIRLTRLAWMPILSRGAYGRQGRDGTAMLPMGSGPYRVERHAPGQSMTLKRHADYRGQKSGARIDTVEIRIITSAETRVALLMSGDLHWDFGLTQDQLEPLLMTPHLKIEEATTLRVAALQMDAAGRAGQTALTSKAVRQAIAHAVDRTGIVRHLWGQPDSAVLNAFCAPGTFGCDQSAVRGYAFDPDRARHLLRDAGFANGFDVELSSPIHRPEVAVIASNLRDVGIRVKVNVYPPAAYARLRDAGELQMTYVAFGGSQLGDVVAGVYDYHYSFGQRDMARDSYVRDRVQEAMRLVDQDQRLAIVRELEPYLADQMYNLPINVWSRPYVMNRALDWRPTPDELPALYQAGWI